MLTDQVNSWESMYHKNLGFVLPFLPKHLGLISLFHWKCLGLFLFLFITTTTLQNQTIWSMISKAAISSNETELTKISSMNCSYWFRTDVMKSANSLLTRALEDIICCQVRYISSLVDQTIENSGKSLLYYKYKHHCDWLSGLSCISVTLHTGDDMLCRRLFH